MTENRFCMHKWEPRESGIRIFSEQTENSELLQPTCWGLTGEIRAQYIHYWESEDLINFTDNLIKVHNRSNMHAWAPEVFL